MFNFYRVCLIKQHKVLPFDFKLYQQLIKFHLEHQSYNSCVLPIASCLSVSGGALPSAAAALALCSWRRRSRCRAGGGTRGAGAAPPALRQRSIAFPAPLSAATARWRSPPLIASRRMAALRMLLPLVTWQLRRRRRMHAPAYHLFAPRAALSPRRPRSRLRSPPRAFLARALRWRLRLRALYAR